MSLHVFLTKPFFIREKKKPLVFVFVVFVGILFDEDSLGVSEPMLIDLARHHAELFALCALD
jgi:hypothetical protein